MAKIELNYGAQIELVDKLRNAGAGVGGEMNISSPSTLPVVLQYLKDLVELAGLLNDYSEMVSKDCKTFKQLADNIKAADES